MAKKMSFVSKSLIICMILFGSHANASDSVSNEAMQQLQKAKVDQVVLIVRNFIASSHNYTYFNEGFKPGGGLYLYGKKGFKQLIDAHKGEILDAELSYDATEILFSWKKNSKTNYDLYLISIDGTNLRQLTHHPSNNFNASWLPDGGIAFLSDRDSNVAYCMHSSSAVLYRMELNGSSLKRLSANYLSDIAPHVMHDGKVMYCRWEYIDRNAIPCQGLWAQNPDGTGLKHIFGGRLINPITISEAKSIPGTTKIIATLTGHNNAICGGIGVIDPNKGANNFDAVKTILGEMVVLKNQGGRNKNQKYEFPYPVNEKFFLVSNDGAIELSDYEGQSAVTLLGKDDGPAKGDLGFYAALPVQVRKREPIIPSQLKKGSETANAKILMQDVYSGLGKQSTEHAIKRGDIKELRVVESISKKNLGHQWKKAFCWQFPAVSGGATWEPKKTISTVKIEADGSAMFEVPAMKPVYFQALDAEGRVIQRMRTFTQFMPGEVQSCTGCHMDRNSVAPSNKIGLLALDKPLQKINGAPWQEHKDGFSYTGQVQPVWDKNCVSCHNAKKQSANLDLSGDRTDIFNVSYDNLVRTGPNRNPSKTTARAKDFTFKYISYMPTYNRTEHAYLSEELFKVKSWGSYKSNLVKVIRSGHKDSKGKARVALTDIEKRTVYAWIDYNVPYYHTSHTNHPKTSHGMRDVTPPKFDETLLEVTERRCSECHSSAQKKTGWWGWNKKTKALKVPLDFYLRWEKPELNNFMLAPLAKEAGGTQTCVTATFKNTNDADYQKLLRAFDFSHKKVATRLRVDMDGAEEIASPEHTKPYKNKEQP